MSDCSERQQRGGFWEDTLTGRCAFPIAPVNTWTNLAYLVAAWGVGHLGTSAAGVEAALLTCLGVGSGLFHGFKTVFTDRLDNAGMYLTYGGLLVYTLAPLSPWTPLAMALVGIVLAWRLAFIPVPDDYESVIMGCFVGAVTIAVALHGHPLHALAGFALLGVAYAIWWMDMRRTFWLPRWGHGCWHVLTAIATYLLFVGR